MEVKKSSCISSGTGTNREDSMWTCKNFQQEKVKQENIVMLLDFTYPKQEERTTESRFQCFGTPQNCRKSTKCFVVEAFSNQRKRIFSKQPLISL